MNSDTIIAGQVVRSFADDLESWQIDHITANQCCRLEDKLKYCNPLFRVLNKFATSRFPSINKVIGLPSTELEEARRTFDTILVACGKISGCIADFEKLGYRVDGSDKFRVNRVRLSGVVDVIEFVQRAKRKAAEDCSRSFRPVHVDEAGLLFEVDGTRIAIPGLEPEKILEGLKDIEEGNLVPLSDITESRR